MRSVGGLALSLSLLAVIVIWPFPVHADPPVKVFIDTDIGSDVDDVLALLMALGRSDYQVLGVSTVNGPVRERARLVHAVLNRLRREDVPVGPGVGSTLLRDKQPRHQAGSVLGKFEALPPLPADSPHGVDLLIEQIQAHPGLTVVAIGPLTNMALAIIKDPSIVDDIGQLIIVGGATHLPPEVAKASIYVDYKSEYNLNSDPHAAQVVFGSGVPIIMSGLAPALEVYVTRKQIQDWQEHPSELAQWTARQVLARLDAHYSDSTHLGDVLGMALAAHPDMGEIHRMPVHLERWGKTLRTVIDPTGTGRVVDVVTRADRERLMSLFEAGLYDAFEQSHQEAHSFSVPLN